jgi:hypothetical protein
MRPATPLVLTLTALAALAGCGDSESASPDTLTSTSAAASTTTAPAPTTTTPATATTPATTTGAKGATGASPYIMVSSLLGKRLPKEPRCQFAKTFVPDKPTAYDGALTLTVTCEKSGGYTAVGQIVNRVGSKPTEITCRDTTGGQLYCIYVPSTTVGLYFTGTDRAVVRRRLEHLIEIVAPLPRGITPLPGTSTP